MAQHQPEDDPVGAGTDLDEADIGALREQVRHQLQRLIVGSQMTEEAVGHAIGYSTGSQISKILNGNADLPVPKARELDALVADAPPVWQFEALARAVAARRPYERTRGKPVLTGSFDVFLAVPMASTSDGAEYRRIRELARDTVAAMMTHCGYRVYCAAVDVEELADFDSPGFAIAENIHALMRSKRFVLLVPKAVHKPSSVWVEAGIALALGKPCTFLIPDQRVLPYILQEAAEPRGIAGLGTVRVKWTNDVQSAAALIVKHKRRLFEGD